MPQLNKVYRKTNSVSSNSPLGMDAISPLQRFVRAKKLINQTFDELAKYLREARDFLVDCEISDELDVETRKDLEQVEYKGFEFEFEFDKHQYVLKCCWNCCRDTYSLPMQLL